MKRAFLTQILLISAILSFAQGASVFEKGSRFGLLNSNNKVIIKPIYDYIYPLKDHFFLVEKNKKIGVVSDDGKIVLEPIFDDVQSFGDNYFVVQDKGRCGVLDKFQRIVVPVEYKSIESLTDYLFIVNSKDGKKGIINRIGETLLSAHYDEITGLSDFLFVLKNKGYISIIDHMGQPVLSGDFDSLEKLDVPNLYKVTLNGKIGVIDLTGKNIAQPVFDKIDCSNNDYILLEKDNKIGFIMNSKLIPAIYDKIVFSQPELGIIVVKSGNKNGFVTTGGLIIPAIYDNISRFATTGHALVEKNGKIMYLDMTGKEQTIQEVMGGTRRF